MIRTNNLVLNAALLLGLLVVVTTAQAAVVHVKRDKCKSMYKTYNDIKNDLSTKAEKCCNRYCIDPTNDNRSAFGGWQTCDEADRGSGKCYSCSLMTNNKNDDQRWRCGATPNWWNEPWTLLN